MITDERFPDSLDAIEKQGLPDFKPHRHTNLPSEPFIYLGAGLTLSSDEKLPLCISPPYRENGTNFRQVVTLGGGNHWKSGTRTWTNGSTGRLNRRVSGSQSP